MGERDRTLAIFIRKKKSIYREDMHPKKTGKNRYTVQQLLKQETLGSAIREDCTRTSKAMVMEVPTGM